MEKEKQTQIIQKSYLRQIKEIAEEMKKMEGFEFPNKELGNIFVELRAMLWGKEKYRNN